MQYDVYGNVYEKRYVSDEYSLYPIYSLWLEAFENSNKLFEYILARCTCNIHIWEDDLKEKRIKKLKDNKISLKLNKENFNGKSFIKYEFLKTIDIGREFKDGDLFTYNNNDYKVTYKYNSDKDRHELYINYTCKVIIDYELDNRIDNLIKDTNELIKNYNEDIEKQIKEIIKEPKIIHEKIPILIENKSWITKLINKMKGVK